jgi:phage shock protein PspC (stress-responsive transcriptional regulator)
MKKTFTANLNGIVFHIEEDAYDQLQRYLANIRAKFSGSNEAEEVMGDIEARIAELFNQRLQGRQAVSMADVDHVKQVMGQPEDYVDGENANEEPARGGSWASSGGPRRHKRLFRDMDDRWVGGVIGGIANYFGTEALWFRIAFIVLVVAGWGMPVVIYLLLWAFVPQAATAAERLEMRGEPVTVDNIKRVFEEGTERMKAGGERVAQEAREFGRNWGQQYRYTGSRAGEIITKLVGFIMVLVGISMFIGLASLLVGGWASLWQGDWSSDNVGAFALGGYLFNSSTQAVLFAIGAFLVAALPVCGMLLAGFRLLRGTPSPKWLGWTLGLTWIAALLVVVATSLRLGNDFRRKTTVRTNVPLEQPAQGILYLDMLPQEDSTLNGWSMRYRHGRMDVDLRGIHLENGMISGAWAELDVQQSPDSLFHLLVLRQARGNTVKNAAARAERTGFDYRQDSEVLLFSPLLRFPGQDKFRAQDVRYIVQVPMGKSVYFREGSKPLLDDIDNTTNTWDDDMVGRTWTMTPKGLEDPALPQDQEEAHPGVAPAEAPAEAPAAPPMPDASAVERISATFSGTGMEPAWPNLFLLLTSALRA